MQCNRCWHIFNKFFSDREIDSSQDLFLTNTPINESMLARHEQTVDFLTANANKKLRILDVGAGSGALAAAFAKRGHQVTVVEPSAMIDERALNEFGVNVVKDFWPAISLRDQKFDLILCVQVLEHTSEPCSFLSTLSDSLDKNGEIYLEIPSGDWVVEHASIADIHYPHLSYFVTKVIYGIFEKVSLVPFATRNLLNGRDLGFVLRAIESVSPAKTLGSNADALASLLSKNIERAKSRIIRLSSKGKFAIYGANAGSQALFGFFPHIKPEFILDDTPSYVGAYGYNYESRFQILKPTVENLGRVQSVVIAAYIHDKVIAERLRALGFMGEIFSLRPESDLSGTVQSLFAS